MPNVAPVVMWRWVWTGPSSGHGAVFLRHITRRPFSTRRMVDALVWSAGGRVGPRDRWAAVRPHWAT